MAPETRRDEPPGKSRADTPKRAPTSNEKPSAFSAPPKGRNVLQQKTPGAEENSVCYTWLKSRESQLAKTSHIDRAVFEHGAAGLGLYKRAARRKVRFVFHGAVAVRRGAAHGRGRHRHHSCD